MISVVIPVRDERLNLRPLCAELREAAARDRLPLEVVFVDDGSTDGTWAEIQTLTCEFESVAGIRLRRNFGKSAALSAGIEMARGDVICTMDGDGQDDPAEIAPMLRALEADLDVVSGWKAPRRDPWRKRLPSWVFNRMVRALTGVRLHDHNCGMKLYRREVFDEIRLYGELHRFAAVLADARGFRVGERRVHHRPRQHGRSKYGAGRFLKGMFDLITVKLLTGFRDRPHHPLGILGMLSFAVGLLAMTYLAGTWLVRLWAPEAFAPLSQRPLLVYAIAAFLFGAQMMSIAFIAALVTDRARDGRCGYSVAARIEPGPAAEAAPPDASPLAATARYSSPDQRAVVHGTRL